MSLEKLNGRLEELRNPEKAKLLQGFFKTGKGQYGEGDVFYGIVVPEQRKLVSEFWELGMDDVQELLDSEIHEKRLIGLLILVKKFEKGSDDERARIYDFYLKNVRRVNNWDLVDLSAHKIVGGYLVESGDRLVLYRLVKSDNLWERRISVISCFAFIREGDFDDCLKISEELLSDKHDLIHKAVGWMLREVGKKNIDVLELFLSRHYGEIPRTMLRYAIERMEEGRRKGWLRGEV